MKSGNSAMVRRINREVVREALRARGEAGIAELSRRTGLSPATCSNIIPELVSSGEVFELDERRSEGGRPARVYAYNPDHTLVAAILPLYAGGGTVIRHSIRNGAGLVVHEGAAASEPFSLERLDGLLADLLRAFPAIRAVAVSVPGVVDDGAVGICDIPELSGAPLEQHVRSRHGLATVVENDMNFAAVGYQSRHPETTGSGLAFLALPEGKCPGCGIVLGGTLVKGKSNFAGEVSFIPFGCASGSVEETAARLCCAVTAVVNPGAVVLSGSAVREDMLDRIRELCLARIPERHLPELSIRPEYGEDCLDGMAAMARACLACDVRLVENPRGSFTPRA